ncbi:hypothetical protein F511_40464 [Dorcoceras hygrometricum]|uniref:Uncharacterized protein n=1 Tax=Dorcoceras hygrometricum TaxID=472368 RepID=A0A2Z7BVI1_9LAMI|nr:hypothetical protein F511_40464 [Dorcoceras hygrometricum]
MCSLKYRHATAEPCLPAAGLFPRLVKNSASGILCNATTDSSFFATAGFLLCS